SLLALRRVPLKVRDGIPVWLCTVTIGMVLRGLTHAGTAFSFIVVATLFLGAMLLGWRAVAMLMSRRRACASPRSAGAHEPAHGRPEHMSQPTVGQST
ncbi:MAG: DUF3054 domain-containing protein, partial [Dermatophilaceae bacterium]